MKIEYHGNFLDMAFKDANFVNRFTSTKIKKSQNNSWTHYLIHVDENELEKTIKETQANLMKKKFYVHLYDKNGKDVIVIFPDIVIRGSHKSILETVIYYGRKLNIPRQQLDVKPSRFNEEEEYYK